MVQGMLSNSAVLIGIICGYVLCMILPLFISTTGVASDGTEFVKSWVLNWDKVAQAKWFALPKLIPVKPVFDLRAILPDFNYVCYLQLLKLLLIFLVLWEGGMSEKLQTKNYQVVLSVMVLVHLLLLYLVFYQVSFTKCWVSNND